MFFGGLQQKVIGSVSIREMDLTDDGLSGAASASAPQPLTQRAYMSDLKLQEAYRKPVRFDGRRCSLAVEMMRECEAIALEWGYDETYLNVYERNAAPAKLYVDKLGYEIIGRREKASTTGSAILYMRKKLSPASDAREETQPSVLNDILAAKKKLAVPAR